MSSNANPSYSGLLGRKLEPEEIEQLHRAMKHLEDPGFWDIVEQGHKEFDEPGEEKNEDRK